MLSGFLDKLIAFAAKDEVDLVRARKEWEERAGQVFDDDPLYEERSAAFLEWYALERIGRDGRVPVERFLSEGRLDDREGQWATACQRSHRSLFQVVSVKDGSIFVEDLLGGARFEVAERRKLPGMDEGEVFETRLVASIAEPPTLLFSRSFQFHPRSAVKEVRRLAARARDEHVPREEVLFRLARCKLKTVRYQHVEPARIYASDAADKG